MSVYSVTDHWMISQSFDGFLTQRISISFVCKVPGKNEKGQWGFKEEEEEDSKGKVCLTLLERKNWQKSKPQHILLLFLIN